MPSEFGTIIRPDNRLTMVQASQPKCLIVDLETVPAHDGTPERIIKIGALRPDRDEALEVNIGKNLDGVLRQLDNMAEGASFVLGHNIIEHDLPILQRVAPHLALLQLPVIDTLRLSPLAFPQNPYHRLIKDYKLIRDSLNSPLVDCRSTLTLFLDQHQALERLPAKRFGYILQVTKERYKDTSLDLGNAGEKVKALINEHLISLGINPKVAPVELLAEDFLEKLAAHAGTNNAAKASEMEHAIRKHCTVHHDEDPAFYKSLSEKVDALIEKHHDEWELLAEKLAELRSEAIAGRRQGEDGMSREATTFYQHIIQVGFADGIVDEEAKPQFKALMESVVDILQETIGSIDFWQNPDKQKRVRGLIKTEISKTGIEELKQNRERVAVEIMKLAKNRHDELVRSAHAGDA